MDESSLKAILDSEIRHAMGYVGGELSDQRRKAMDYYLGEPFGNEKEGRSQVVLTDVADTVEWILPSLMRIFTSKSDAVIFEPVGPEDEEAAAQESDYINHVFYTENNGFLLLYTWFKDALLSKNGIIKAWWDDTEEKNRERYRNLSEPELAMLLSDPYIEPVEHEQTETGHNVTVICTKKGGRLRMAVVPPEEFLVARDATSLDLQETRFVAHRVERTISNLRAAGYDTKQLETIPTGEGWSFNDETITRRHLDDESPEYQEHQLDKSQRKVWVYECHLNIDYDDDGIAELRKITKAGNEILDNEPAESIPFHALTPVILTHKFYGLSMADLVMDLQLIKSTLMRQMLDNLYLTNNPEREVVSGRVNMDDMMTSRPGGIKRVKEPGMIRDLAVPFTAGSSFPVLEYLDQVRKSRTGVGADVMGLDQNTLSNANTGVVAQSFDAAQMRIELIARIFAETGVKSLLMGIHELLLKHSDKPKIVKLRNKWVPVDPTEWRHRSNMSINVGLGTGNRDQQLMHLERILQHQATIVQNGGMGTLVTPGNVYNALARVVENAGLKNPELYFTDPQTVEQQPQQEEPDAQIMAIQVQAQIEQGKLQLEGQKLEFEKGKAAADAQHKAEGVDVQRQALDVKAELEVLKQQVALFVAQSKLDSQTAAETLPEIDEAVEGVMADGSAVSTESARVDDDQIEQLAGFLIQSQHETGLNIGKVAAQIADLSSALASMGGALSAPKQPMQVIRDEEGRITSIGDRSLVRDAAGNVQGVV